MFNSYDVTKLSQYDRTTSRILHSIPRAAKILNRTAHHRRLYLSK